MSYRRFINSSALPLLALYFLTISACAPMTAVEHHETLPSTKERELTIGVVQKEIREGMNQAEVAEQLGSPNIVTRDRDGRETWIYDKISTETAYSSSKGGVNALILGLGLPIAGGGAAGFSKSSGATTSTQRTLTIIIKFREGLVDEFSYHTSRF